MDPTPGGVVQEVECYRVPLDSSQLFCPEARPRLMRSSQIAALRNNLNESDGDFRGWVANQTAGVWIQACFILKMQHKSSPGVGSIRIRQRDAIISPVT